MPCKGCTVTLNGAERGKLSPTVFEAYSYDRVYFPVIKLEKSKNEKDGGKVNHMDAALILLYDAGLINAL